MTVTTELGASHLESTLSEYRGKKSKKHKRTRKKRMSRPKMQAKAKGKEEESDSEGESEEERRPLAALSYRKYCFLWSTVQIAHNSGFPRYRNSNLCSLNVFSFQSAPAYTALSYTWGKSEPSTIISLDGAPFEVGPNLT